jgi:hypothetical protein
MREREGVYPMGDGECAEMCEGTGVACVAVCPIAWGVCINELQNFRVGSGHPLPRFFVSVDSGEVEVEWNQQL